jgi:DNA replication licensing factor MCM7
MYVTPRTLLAIIRLSQSLSKLSFRSVVNQADVDEAIKLMDFSIRSLRTLKAADQAGSKGRNGNAAVSQFRKDDRMTEIIKAVRKALTDAKSPSLGLNEILKMITRDRMSSIGKLDKDELTTVVNHYKQLQILWVDENGNVAFL